MQSLPNNEEEVQQALPGKSNNSLPTWFVILVFVIIGFFLYYQFTESDDSSPPKNSSTVSAPSIDGFNAQADCESFVSNSLKAPSSAHFPNFREINVADKGNGKWVVNGYVDSQNSFGAMLRTRYRCKVRYESGGVILDSLKFIE